MDDNKNKVVSSQVMELQQLIAVPLIATIDADTQSAKKYLVKIAFEEYPETGGFGKLRQLTFSYTEPDVNGTHKRTVNMKVKVKMRQADMPAGLSNLLHITANNVHR